MAGHGGPFGNKYGLKHGMSRSPEYSCWRGIKRRCLTPDFKYYSERGIKMCKRWMSFERFLSDVGLRPSSQHSLDRYPDNDGDYKPSNVRWATPKQQAVNQRRTYKLKDGTPLIDEVRRRGLSESAIRNRLRSGWTLDEAITVPVRRKRRAR